MHRSPPTMELLAPAGNFASLVAAVQNGADAVYLGGNLFSARAYAANFDREELDKAVTYAHLRGVKLYVTVNTLLREDELRIAADYLRFLYETGVDAVIVQDLGVARLVKELFPRFELHASTQMTIHSLPGAQTLEKLGFDRVVLARELSLAEIKEIAGHTPLGVEVFVHGALCVSYSGQCLMSSMLGGRSGNRGRCAQPCRLPYELVEKTANGWKDLRAKGHLLSPKDLALLSRLPDLAAAGVQSLKIEGRMKRPEYVAVVVRVYREALDRLAREPERFSAPEKALAELAQIFSRGFTEGYLSGYAGRDFISRERPNNQGVEIGTVLSYNARSKKARVKLIKPLSVGDGIEIRAGGEEGLGLTVSRLYQNQREVSTLIGEGDLPVPRPVNKGQRIYKTADAEQLAEAAETFARGKELRRIPLTAKVKAAVGAPFSLMLESPDGHRAEAQSSEVGKMAINRPLTREYLFHQLQRLGNTPYQLADLQADIAENVMVPASVINDVRRRAVETLDTLRLQTERPPVTADFERKMDRLFAPSAASRVEKPLLAVKVGSEKAVKIAKRAGADIVYGPANTLPRTSQGKVYEAFWQRIKEQETKLSEVLVGDLGGLPKNDPPSVSLWGDYSLNIFNPMAVTAARELGLGGVCLSTELTLSQIREIAQKTDFPLEIVVHGRLPLMITEHCPVGATIGGKTAERECSRPCRLKEYGLKDRMGKVFPLLHDPHCRTQVLNADILCMIDELAPLIRMGLARLRLELTEIESERELEEVVTAYRATMDELWENPDGTIPEPASRLFARMENTGYTRGHFFRGVE